MFVDRNGVQCSPESDKKLGPFHKDIGIDSDSLGMFHVNLDGNPLLGELRFPFVEPFYNGRALFFKNGQWGLLEESGKHALIKAPRPHLTVL